MKLNIGAGTTEIEGFTAIDRRFGGEAYPLSRITGKDDNGQDIVDTIETNSVEEIRASHILEHFSFNEVPKVLNEWVRVLKPGGLIRISVPDLDKILEQRQRNDPLWSRYLMGGQTDANDYHKTIFTAEELRSVMGRAGLSDICAWASDNIDTASHPVSVNLQGKKPDDWQPPEDVAKIQIRALMSLPRYGANASRSVIEHTLHTFGIGLSQHGGAYWSHTMQNCMQDWCAEDLDWIITFDHDTMCTPQMLDAMFGIFGRHPEIDALAALQCKRHDDKPLLTIRGETTLNADGTTTHNNKRQIQTDGRPIQVDTAHFGMTLFRMEALRRTPLPWFWEIPKKTGEWEDKRAPHDLPVDPIVARIWDELLDEPGEYHYDADIWFWHQWRKAGNTVFITPMVRCGHLEEVVVDFDDELKPRHRYAHKWREGANEHVESQAK